MISLADIIGDPARVVGIACHDAGGADQLACAIAGLPNPMRFALAGPAREVVPRILGGLPGETVAAPEDLSVADVLLTATSYPADLELRAIKAARRAGVPSHAILDHWTNYAARFERDGTITLPDTVLVCDAAAENLAREALPGTEIARIPDVRLERFRDAAALRVAGLPRGGSVLIVTEPIAEEARLLHGDPRHYGFDEHEELRKLLSELQTTLARGTEIRLKLHPREDRAAYEALIAGFPGLRLSICDTFDEIAEIHAAEAIYGFKSVLLYKAAFLNPETYSLVPPASPCFRLDPAVVRPWKGATAAP